MELKKAIIERRSVKKYDYEMYIDEEKLFSLVDLATYAPNHGMREPWRLVYINKKQIPEFAEKVAQSAFVNDPAKQEKYINKVTKVGGMFVILSKRDSRQKENLENQMAIGAFIQNLMLLIHDEGMGSCWKTPEFIFKPTFRKIVGVNDDEDVNGFLYVTEKDTSVNVMTRKNNSLITEW
ncbi:nitroreductase family protein [Mammaliicoccus fleurettii]|uniref:nitroreductase family protein n=1 Tax=Mammaliicoccus fleurettii TaxID=150056 RepID=UPI002DBD4DA8|nr:nitroreductase [Mammaliicoccus fleurettii]MEB8068272.1 nitroreductase [Mammaliicoccus fleurettii]